MAETEKGKKFIRVMQYTRGDGTKVRSHDRSTPHDSKGVKRTPTRTRKRGSTR